MLMQRLLSYWCLMRGFLDLSHGLDLNLDFPLLFDLYGKVSCSVIIVRQTTSIIRIEYDLGIYVS